MSQHLTKDSGGQLLGLCSCYLNSYSFCGDKHHMLAEHSVSSERFLRETSRVDGVHGLLVSYMRQAIGAGLFKCMACP
jgi:hypothetical protein